jgi:hypothetical protein
MTILDEKVAVPLCVDVPPIVTFDEKVAIPPYDDV